MTRWMQQRKSKWASNASSRRLLFLRLWTTTCRRSKTLYPAARRCLVKPPLGRSHHFRHLGDTHRHLPALQVCQKISLVSLDFLPLQPFLGGSILPSRFPELFVALLWFFVSLSPPLLCLPASAARRDDELPEKKSLSLCPLIAVTWLKPLCSTTSTVFLAGARSHKAASRTALLSKVKSSGHGSQAFYRHHGMTGAAGLHVLVHKADSLAHLFLEVHCQCNSWIATICSAQGHELPLNCPRPRSVTSSQVSMPVLGMKHRRMSASVDTGQPHHCTALQVQQKSVNSSTLQSGCR